MRYPLRQSGFSCKRFFLTKYIIKVLFYQMQEKYMDSVILAKYAKGNSLSSDILEKKEKKSDVDQFAGWMRRNFICPGAETQQI
jgi:hypothetical protein